MRKDDRLTEELAESRHVETIRLALAVLGITGISLGVAYGVWRGWLVSTIMMTIVIVGWILLYSLARRNSRRRKDRIEQLDQEEQELEPEGASVERREQDGTAPALTDIWGQLNDEMRHRETMYLQLIVSMFVFLGAAGALISYVEALKLWVWASGVAVIIAGWVHVWFIASGQKKCHEAALEVQRSFLLPDDIGERLGQLMHEKRQRFSSRPARVVLIVLTSVLWITMAFVVVF